MAVEDFTTYTEVDAGGDYTITASKIDISSIRLDATSYVYSDKGVDFFDGDFVHHWEYYHDSATADGSITGLWAMSNNIEDQAGLNASNYSYFLVMNGSEAGGNINKRFVEHDGSANYQTSVNDTTVAEDTLVYMETERDEAVGTYGTIYNRFYSDSGRTTLLYSTSLTLHTSNKNFRYIYGAMSDGRASAITSTGYVQNLDLSPGGGAAADNALSICNF